MTRILLFFSCILILFISACSGGIREYTELPALPPIYPDYTSLVIPYNIAPLNFNIEEKASSYYVEISSGETDKISIRQDSSKIIIPEKLWHQLLEKNKGGILNIDVFVKQEKWKKYATIHDTIAKESIDNHLVYRLLGVVFKDKDPLGIYQQNIETSKESVIFDNSGSTERPCLNCHSFSNNNPGKMSMHIRKSFSGTVIFDHGKATKYNTKTEYTMTPAAYTAWHPNDELIAFSLNRLFVYFTSNENKLVEVCDEASDIVLYNTKTNTISTCPQISSPRRETAPAWSPDGKWLYFISAPQVTENMTSWVNGKYDLMRIPFNPEDSGWGETELLLSSEKTGKSISWPSATPDGRYIVFCMIDHSYFSIFDKESDLHILDLKTGKYQPINILNSNSSESFHSWSKNGRWMVFSSKKLDDVATRPFFTYFDSTGNFHKPFVLPQENPLYYKSFRMNYNVPVFVDGEVDINVKDFGDILNLKPVNVNFDPSVKIDTTNQGHFTSNYF